MKTTCPYCKIEMELTHYDTEDEMDKYHGKCDNCGRDILLMVEADEEDESQYEGREPVKIEMTPISDLLKSLKEKTEE